MTARLAVSAAIAVAVGALAFAVLDGGGDRPRVDPTAGDAARSDHGRDVQRPAGDAGWGDEGRRVFAAMGCGSCHRLAAAGSTGAIGPDLDEVLAGHDRASLAHSIVRAPGEGFATMPDDYGERMSDAELDALVSFLLASR